jgi:hypothetical protein
LQGRLLDEKFGGDAMEVRITKITVTGTFSNAKRSAEKFMTGIIRKGGSIISSQYETKEGLWTEELMGHVYIITYTVPTGEEKK